MQLKNEITNELRGEKAWKHTAISRRMPTAKDRQKDRKDLPP